MKKQINPTIKAHLIRSAFYLLLLVAVCAIPFALAQRNTIKRANPASKSKMAAAPASGAAQATKLSGVHKAVSKPNADSRLSSLRCSQCSIPASDIAGSLAQHSHYWRACDQRPRQAAVLTPRLLGQAQSRRGDIRRGQPIAMTAPRRSPCRFLFLFTVTSYTSVLGRI